MHHVFIEKVMSLHEAVHNRLEYMNMRLIRNDNSIAVLLLNVCFHVPESS